MTLRSNRPAWRSRSRLSCVAIAGLSRQAEHGDHISCDYLSAARNRHREQEVDLMSSSGFPVLTLRGAWKTAIVFLLVAVVQSVASATAATPSAAHCYTQFLATATGPWTCVDSYTRDGVTKNFGEPGFSPSAPTSAPDATGGTVARPLDLFVPSKGLVSGRSALSRPTMIETKTYQSDFSELADYGVGSQQIGTVRAKAHINLNGRQTQTNMGTLVTVGPTIKPTGSWSSNCGSNSASASGYGLSWGGPVQNGFCSVSGSYSNYYTWSWYATGYPYNFGVSAYSATWTCFSLVTPPCYFGS
jgi:hypothetical protein